MPILQTIVESASRSWLPIIPQGSYYSNSVSYNWYDTNAGHQTYGTMTYPDATTAGVQRLAGQECLFTSPFGSLPSFNINLWFYPTSWGKTLISELEQAAENTGYHYSMLEINDSGYLRGRTWDMVAIDALTSVGTVNLNDWNHLYLYYNDATGVIGMSLNDETTVIESSITRNAPPSSVFGIGVVDFQSMEVNARYIGKFDALTIDTTITGSTYSATVDKYTSP